MGVRVPRSTYYHWKWMPRRFWRLAGALFIAATILLGPARAQAAQAGPVTDSTRTEHCIRISSNQRKAWCQLTHRYVRWRWYENGQFTCLKLLWNRESGWNQFAENPSSGAYGIPQSLPADKMAAAGADWRTDPWTQMRWGYSYIRPVYGNPCHAWQHEIDYGWYIVVPK